MHSPIGRVHILSSGASWQTAGVPMSKIRLRSCKIIVKQYQNSQHEITAVRVATYMSEAFDFPNLCTKLSSSRSSHPHHLEVCEAVGTEVSYTSYRLTLDLPGKKTKQLSPKFNTQGHV